MTPDYGAFQLEIYLAGTQGVLPRYPVDSESLERKAQEVLPPWIWSYVTGGCGNERTQRANVDAFDKWGIVPRMGVGATERDLSVDLFGTTLPSPVFMAPIGVIGICAQDFHGDLAVARAAERTGVPAVQSTLSMDPVEETGAIHQETPGFFQLYMPKDRDLALSFIQRAEQAGYQGIAVTLDTWTPGWRPRDLNTSNFPQLRGMCVSNYFTDPNFLGKLAKSPEEDLPSAVLQWAVSFGQPVSWDDLAWIREVTDLPVIPKGICHPDDVRRAVDVGADAIYCSNHGGRQANGGLSALQHLPDVVAAAGDTPVLFDSGVRSGSDVVLALALGATAVGIGRSYAYALAVGGEDGLVHHLRSILAEADLLMAINGYPTIADLRADGALQRAM
ncbi:alpha-hydroxy-acid oxidizing protein [Gordonia sp. SL306]|uniref:alpha-hydroxy-acid oxidizing protein n=1 Tax=Gordonia sp. SL306 TaxID=2995145 RepID=UPI002271FF56|nr:alpha-hydroxy-acid oxidizing protein [Gordonia sp. SL306]WAC57235.1 alpha-hydroxy-acid oxidizing protein [Gordonia sp. SL306]